VRLHILSWIVSRYAQRLITPNVALRPKQSDWVTVSDTSDKRLTSVVLRPRLITLESRYVQTLASA
jgi:hypothetical protein